MKSLIYEYLFEIIIGLAARIVIVACDILEMPIIFENLQQSLTCTCEACITADGRSFKQLL